MSRHDLRKAPKSQAESDRLAYRDERIQNWRYRQRHAALNDPTNRPLPTGEGRSCLPDLEARERLFEELQRRRPMRSRKMREWFHRVIVRREPLTAVNALLQPGRMTLWRYAKIIKKVFAN